MSNPDNIFGSDSDSDSSSPTSIPPLLPSPPMFEIIDSSQVGGGKGLRSLVFIKAGTEIYRDVAVLRCPNAFAAESEDEAKRLLKECLLLRYSRLSSTLRTSLLTLSSHTETTPTIPGIFQTNALRLTGSDSGNGAIFQTFARMNHSCHPNVEHKWDDGCERLVLKAILDIPAFSEMYISYLGTPSNSTTEVRRAHLKKNFGFKCMCILCNPSMLLLLISLLLLLSTVTSFNPTITITYDPTLPSHLPPYRLNSRRYRGLTKITPLKYYDVNGVKLICENMLTRLNRESAITLKPLSGTKSLRGITFELSSPVDSDVSDVRFKLNRMLPNWICCSDYTFQLSARIGNKSEDAVGGSIILKFKGRISGSDVFYNRYSSKVLISESVHSISEKGNSVNITRVEGLKGGFLININEDFEVEKEEVLGGGVFRFFFEGDDVEINELALEEAVGEWCGCGIGFEDYNGIYYD